MLLHCKYPKVLNIYWAAYGRELGGSETCLAEEEKPPPFGEFISQSQCLTNEFLSEAFRRVACFVFGHF